MLHVQSIGVFLYNVTSLTTDLAAEHNTAFLVVFADSYELGSFDNVCKLYI